MTILLVDDVTSYLSAMDTWFKILFNGSTIHKATRGLEAYGKIPSVKPDVIFLDVNMPELNGLETTRLILKKFPDSKIIILTTVEGESMVLRLAKAGVKGFLFKETDGAEIIECTEKVLSGEKYFCQEVKEIISKNTHILNNLPAIDFDKRERGIIWLLSEGYSAKEIGDIMGLKEKIVINTKENLRKKTKTKNTTELLAYFFYNALLDENDNPLNSN